MSEEMECRLKVLIREKLPEEFQSKPKLTLIGGNKTPRVTNSLKAEVDPPQMGIRERVALMQGYVRRG